jgi:hypothetical protein
MLWGGFVAEVKFGRGFDKVEEIVTALAGYQLRFGKPLCDIMKNNEKTKFPDFQRLLIENEIVNYNNNYWLYTLITTGSGTDILAQWDAKFAATLGNWKTVLKKALDAYEEHGALAPNEVKSCSSCSEQPTNAKELQIQEDGTIQWVTPSDP